MTLYGRIGIVLHYLTICYGCNRIRRSSAHATSFVLFHILRVEAVIVCYAATCTIYAIHYQVCSITNV